MGKSSYIVFFILNLAGVAASAHHFIYQAGNTWLDWLRLDVMVIPLFLVMLAVLSRSTFLLNLSLPFLLYYGLVGQVDSPPIRQDTLIFRLSLLLAVIDVVYVIVVNLKLKVIWPIFWGLLGGVLLLLTYHRVQFGATIRMDLPVLKLYQGMLNMAEKAVSGQNVVK